MIVHNFDPVLVDLGFLQIRWYSLAYIAGILFGWVYAIKIIEKISKNELYFEKINKINFNESIIYIVLGIIFGGRLGYILFYNLDYYSKNFFEIFRLWEGGMSFHGGLVGVVVAIFIFSKKIKINFLGFCDIIACVAPIGIFLGRIANFINGELFGKMSNLPWAIIFPQGGNFPRHPSQIYEAILEGLVLFILINFLALKKGLLLKTGYISCFFLITYSLLRIFSENFREPDRHIGYIFNYLSMGTLLSIITFVIGILMIFSIKKNERNN